MKKLYSLLLLLPINFIWPQEQHTFFARTKQRAVQLQKKYLHQASTYIKRQYQDKQRRRAWFMTATVCIVGLSSWRFRAIEKLFPRKSRKQSLEAKKDKKLLNNRLGQPDIEETQTDTEELNPDDKKIEQKTKEVLASAIEIARTLREKYKITKIGSQQDESDAKSASADDKPPSTSIKFHTSSEPTPASLLKPEQSYFKPGLIVGADAMEAAFKAAGLNIEKDRLYKIEKPPADISYLMPLIRGFRAEKKSIETAKEEALKKARRNRDVTIDEATIDQTLDKAKEIVIRQENAQEKLQHEASVNNFAGIVDALIDGATPTCDDTFFDAVWESAQRVSLSLEQQTALDCILWQLDLPEQIKQLLWTRTIKKISSSDYTPMPQDLFDPLPSSTLDHKRS